MLNVGDAAPDFEATDHQGKGRKLSDFRGKKVLLWFYPKANTPGWTAEGSGFRDLADDYEAKNVQILGVSFDSVAENARFAEKFDFQFPLLCDTDKSISLAYGAASSPSDEYARRIAYLIDEKGRIAEAHAKVDARTYPKEQLARL